MTGYPELYTYVNNKKMRRGHTTGTCAAAASKAAAEAILTQSPVSSVTIHTPKGITLDLPVEDLTFDSAHARCAVRKDGGDDIDATHGALVYSDVTLTDSGIDIDGGVGVGRVTRKGLDQPPGNAAINRVPRSMIRDALEDVASACSYGGGVLSGDIRPGRRGHRSKNVQSAPGDNGGHIHTGHQRDRRAHERDRPHRHRQD